MVVLAGAPTAGPAGVKLVLDERQTEELGRRLRAARDIGRRERGSAGCIERELGDAFKQRHSPNSRGVK
jgi:hypothetical protein